MPFVHVQTIQGCLNAQQKQQLISQLSDVMVEVEGGGNPDFRNMVWITIEEREATSWAIGEMRPTADFIQQFVAQRDGKQGQ